MSDLKSSPIRAMDQLGLAIKKMRKSSGLTQKDLAEKSGVQQARISKIETGHLNAEMQTVFSLLTALNAELIVQKRGQKRNAPSWLD